jgi:hypothetical protein
MNHRHQNGFALGNLGAILAAFLMLQSVGTAQNPTKQTPSIAAAPSISITNIPPSNSGGPDKTFSIAGQVQGVAPAGLKVVVYALAGGTWWVQPTVAEPLTDINSKGGWSTDTHGGTTYAALLVRAAYKPAATAGTLPKVEGDVLASTREAGK